MQMLYNSDSFVVVAFDLSSAELPGSDGQDASARPQRGGYEIVDKFAGKEIFIDGAVAASFKQGVQALVDQGQDEEAFDEYIGRFTTLAQQPLLLH
jgi:hypothetical protein